MKQLYTGGILGITKIVGLFGPGSLLDAEKIYLSRNFVTLQNLVVLVVA